MLSVRFVACLLIGAALSSYLVKFNWNVEPARDIKQEQSTVRSYVRILATWTDNCVSASESERSKITSTVEELEKLNPTKHCG